MNASLKFNELDLISPAVGINIYVVEAVSPIELSLEEAFHSAYPLLALEFVALTFLIIFPEISLWLPTAVKG